MATWLHRGVRRGWPPCRKALYWMHRWLGIAGCLLFAMWFFSGVVMMYVAFPSLTDTERRAGLAPLALDGAVVSPGAALASLPDAAGARPPKRLVLEMSRGEPVWRIVDASGRPHAVSARTGRPAGPIDAVAAEEIARQFSGHPDARFAQTLAHDQWTVPNGLNPWRPLHRIQVNDAVGTELYVSAVTGDVVRDTTRPERFWNWLGAVPHWLYFTPLRADPPLWRAVVLWVSGVCIVSAVTGIVIGILRVRLRRRYRSGAVTPYRGWMAWHHIAGLVGGLFIVTWIASGWLSMDPNRWFQRTGLPAQAIADYQRAAPGDVPWPPRTHPPEARDAQLLWFDGQPMWQWTDGMGQATVTDASGRLQPAWPRDRIRAAAARLVRGAPAPEVTWLTEADAHWYGHHRTRMLPAWRLVYADAARTWVHVDPSTGQVLGQTDGSGRLRRWLFNGAHSLDFPWLIANRPAWDVVVWLLSIAGLVVSVSGVVVGWRWLRRRR